jgi:hypothetical protein
MLAEALAYLRHGLRPIPNCVPIDKTHCHQHGECGNPGKVPLVKWKVYQTRAPTEAEVRGWVKKWFAGNLGAALGAHLRLDVEGPLGEAELARQSGGTLPETWEFTSGRGRGLLFAVPEGVELRTTHKPLAVGQELRLQGLGAQTVLPPSLHYSGRRYTWLPGRAPGEIPAAEAPAWMVEAMRKDPPKVEGAAVEGAAAPAVTPAAAALPVGRGELVERARREVAGMPAAVDGDNGSIALFNVALLLGRGYALVWPEARPILLEYSGRCQGPWSDAELRHKWQTALEDGRKPFGFALGRGAAAAGPAAADDRAYQFKPVRITELAPARSEWLIPGVLVKDEAFVIGGPMRSFKSLVALNLGIALATGRPFLGHFRRSVWEQREVRTVFLCGEMSQAAAWESAALMGDLGPRSVVRDRPIPYAPLTLVSAAERWRPRELFIGFDLPRLGVPTDLRELGRGLADGGFEVCLTDPLYLTMLVGRDPSEAANLFATGPLLDEVVGRCREAGCQVGFIHHTVKGVTKPGPPIGQEALSYGGISEYFRQRILLNHREAFSTDLGLAKLWLQAGGSAGHGGCWGLDVRVGVGPAVAGDGAGPEVWKPWDPPADWDPWSSPIDRRCWHARVLPGSECRAVAPGRGRLRAEEDDAADTGRIIGVLEAQDPTRAGLTFRRLRTLTNIREDRLQRLCEALAGDGRLRWVKLRVRGAGPGGAPGVVLVGE